MVMCAGTLAMSSCYFEKDIQVERVNVELVKIDTIFRQSGSVKVLTWKTANRLSYVSLEPIDAPQMNIGSTSVMLIKR